MAEHKISKKILIAPLDWGLGHATRCIPIIKQLLLLNCDVTVAATPLAKNLLKAEFPNLTFLNICAYNIVYSKSKRWMPFKILIQIPKILKTIETEYSWLQNLLKTTHFDAVISDNRYGLYAKNVPCIFVTHQLQIRTSFNLLQKIMQKLNYKRINKFNKCWIPDFAGEPNISGKLAHPKKLPKIPLQYIGPLSRFKKIANAEIVYKYFFMISGPEPQRTLLEESVFTFAASSTENILIVLGKPSGKKEVKQSGNVTVFNHLPTDELQSAISKSEYIVCRSGYTSVMEILAVGKRSILIPTPGQTEQEYLAKHLMREKWCYYFLQYENFSDHFKKAETFAYNLPKVNTALYKTAIENFIQSLKNE